MPKEEWISQGSNASWLYSIWKKGDVIQHMSAYDDVKCIECKQQGLANDPEKTNAHCLECNHCYDHCISIYADCLCCCVEPHCSDCTWHITDEDCDPFECECCCNSHCVSCGHTSDEECKTTGDNSCNCCGCVEASAETSKPDYTKITMKNDLWYNTLVGSHSDKVNYLKVLGPKEILKDIGKFYILIAHEDKKLLDAHKKTLAQRMLNYLTISCAGEARHTPSKTHGDITKLGEMAQTMISAMDGNSNLMNRQYMWSAAYDLAQVSGYLPILEALEEMFNLSWVTGSYGGKKWAKIAELAKNYANGDYTEAIFIDGIMNVVHNGGWAFNKYYTNGTGGNYYSPGITMQKLLDYKKEADKTSIYALLVPLSIPVEGNEKIWKAAKELGVVNEQNELTAKYGPTFMKDKNKYQTTPYYANISKVTVPSAAYIEYIKQQKEKEVVTSG